jgi:riboflavin biosynthesis pyrimidine reductase
MKPHVICHMLSPLDGRLIVDAWAPEDSDLYKGVLAEYQRLHNDFKADAWLAGTNTMKEFTGGATAPEGAAATGETPARPWHLADQAARHFAIAIDRKAQLHWKSATADQGHIVVILGTSVSDAHLAELAAGGLSYLVMPDDAIDLASMLNELGERIGIRTLLLEGGAKMNGAFLQAGLVDEISLLLCPAIDGSTGSPAIFEAGEGGLQGAAKLALVSATPGAADTCHLRYRVSY